MGNKPFQASKTNPEILEKMVTRKSGLRQQLLQIAFCNFTFLGGFVALKFKTITKVEEFESNEMPHLMFMWILNIIIHCFFLNMIVGTIIDNLEVMCGKISEIVVFILTCGIASNIMVYITSPLTSIFSGFAWFLSATLVFFPEFLLAVMEKAITMKNPSLWFLMCAIVFTVALFWRGMTFDFFGLTL
jgi:hypothetical protein